MDGLTMIEMSPESFAAENIRQGFCKPEDRHEEVIRYYRRFIKGCNYEIATLYARIKELEAELKPYRDAANG